MSTDRVIGIDFGTVKTLVARWDAGRNQPAMIRLNADRSDELSTVLHVSETGRLSFGDDAEEAALGDGGGYLRAFKRDLGFDCAPYRLHSHEYTARAATREFLCHIKDQLEKDALHGKVEHAVLGVPAAFLPEARTELLGAASDAGFGPVTLLDEPVAAGLGFFRTRPDLWPSGGILVFDWGGGSLNLAVLNLRDSQPEVIPDLVRGHLDLGGEELDRLLLQNINQRLGQLNLTKLERRTPLEIEGVRRTVVRWKIRHGAQPEATWRLHCLADAPANAPLIWKSEDLAQCIEDKMKAVVDACAQMVTQAGKRHVTLAGILLSGGSSQLPALKPMLTERFPDLKLLTWDQRLTAVALGAAWQAAGHIIGEAHSGPEEFNPTEGIAL
jgi:molecular chaperone DnaK (HSP70)